MKAFDIESLTCFPSEITKEYLKEKFQSLLERLTISLNLEFGPQLKPIFPNVKFDIIDILKTHKSDFINFGVIKSMENGVINIMIFHEFINFTAFILLREAYKCFIPWKQHENKDVNYFINEKVELDFEGTNIIKDWIEYKENNVMTKEYQKAQYDRLASFLSWEGRNDRPSPFKFFLMYIRRNADLIEYLKQKFYGRKSFYDVIWEAYIEKFVKYSDDELETIRVLIDIFYMVRRRSSILEYKTHFRKLKESGKIETNQTYRRFDENMKKLKQSNIAPSYKINWSALQIKSVFCILRFHPLLEGNKIHKVVSRLPFFLVPQYFRNGFSIEVSGYFLLPEVYVDDLARFLNRLESEGYLIKKRILIVTTPQLTVNLNHFTSVFSKLPLLNPNKRMYRQYYETEHCLEYGNKIYSSNLSLLDWFLIDRIKYVSVTGFGFERRMETLKKLKEDLVNEVNSQQDEVATIKKNLNKVHTSSSLSKSILGFIENNETNGFFYIYYILRDFQVIMNALIEKLEGSPFIRSISQLQIFLATNGISESIEENNTLKYLKKELYRSFMPLYFRSKEQFQEKVKEFRYYYNLFESCNRLKLFNLNQIKKIIKDTSLVQKIYEKKEQKLKEIYESYYTRDITHRAIEHRLDEFLYHDPPVIEPHLLATLDILYRYSSYYISGIVKDTPEARNVIEKIQWYFPLIFKTGVIEYETHEKYIALDIKFSPIHIQEKQLLFSLVDTLFQKDLVEMKPFYTGKFQAPYSRKDFYDLEQENFYYTKDLFEQFYPYVIKTFDKEVSRVKESSNEVKSKFWENYKSISHLTNQIEKRVSREHLDLSRESLNNLLEYHADLNNNLREKEKFLYYRNEYFFTNHIKSIKFIPVFQKFGFGQYYLYFHPTDLSKIDFEHLLHNSFQKIKFPANIDTSTSFFITFIWPYRNPNDKVLNWLVKAKKVIREYCLFFVKKVYHIFHFDYNLNVEEWDLNSERFKKHFQNILSNPEYHFPIFDLKQFNVGDVNSSNYYTPNSSEYEALTELYSRTSVDLKSFMGTKFEIKDKILELIDKNLIFPYLSVKNLGFLSKITIILPDVSLEVKEKLLKIFSFFNYGFIYEIEGEYFIYGFFQEKRFENGLKIKLYLPKCRIEEFELLFTQLFEFLNIPHYIYLGDMFDGKQLLKSIYGNLDFLKKYNPLKNLIWNEKDKRWMNHKLYDKDFNELYPDLICKE